MSNFFKKSTLEEDVKSNMTKRRRIEPQLSVQIQPALHTKYATGISYSADRAQG